MRRQTLRVQRALAVLVLVGLLTACSSSKPNASDPPSSEATTTSTAGSTRPAAPKFDVVLDDKGLTFPPGKTPAGRYVVSFEDRRTTPHPDEHLRLEFRPSGPYIRLVDVRVGTSVTHVLAQNMVAFVIDLDGVPRSGFYDPRDTATNGVERNFPVTNGVDIEATPQYPTPVT